MNFSQNQLLLLVAAAVIFFLWYRRQVEAFHINEITHARLNNQELMFYPQDSTLDSYHCDRDNMRDNIISDTMTQSQHYFNQPSACYRDWDISKPGPNSQCASCNPATNLTSTMIGHGVEDAQQANDRRGIGSCCSSWQMPQ